MGCWALGLLKSLLIRGVVASQGPPPATSQLTLSFVRTPPAHVGAAGAQGWEPQGLSVCDRRCSLLQELLEETQSPLKHGVTELLTQLTQVSFLPHLLSSSSSSSIVSPSHLPQGLRQVGFPALLCRSHVCPSGAGPQASHFPEREGLFLHLGRTPQAESSGLGC